MCVGAGLSFAGMKSAAARWQGISITTIKLLITPPVVWAACRWMGIEGLQRDIAILFATMPTASSAYILAVRMGGNGPLTAGLVSISTLGSMVTITLWVTVLQALG
jgi:predicted permease